MNEIDFWNYLLETIESKIKTVLMIVAQSVDSSPGREGFKMIVREDGKLMGTIGGGIMERNMVDYARELISQNKSTAIRRLHHSLHTCADKSGMICGGYQTILFKAVGDSEKGIVQRILDNLQKNKNGLLSVSNDYFGFDESDDQKENCTFNYSNDEEWVYKETIGRRDTAYIIGGGHVGLAVSQIMNFIGFHVVVMDHRPEIFQNTANVFADEMIVTTYDKIAQFIKEGKYSYVIIVTPQHSGDKDALKAVLNMNLKYLGMMGSRKKIKTLFEEIVAEGFDKEKLAGVHSPIGLEIEAETPQEIAISIAAEIIKIKYE